MSQADPFQSPEPRARLYNPDAEPVYDPGMAADDATLWHAIRLRIESLRLRAEEGSFDAEAFKNIETTLTRFASAWLVRLDDGKTFLVPVTEPQRRTPLQICAADETGALDAAFALAKLDGPPKCQSPVMRNGDRFIRDCSSDDLMRWLLVNPQWVSGHTKRNNLIAIVECFAWFNEEHGVKSPFRRKRIPKFVRGSRREATDAEYVALMRHGCRQLRRLLWCHYNLVGIRPGEVRGMIWADFDWDGGFVLTFRHKTARETNKPRLFALTARQLRFFANLYRQRPANAVNVFLNTRGEPWTRRAVALNLRRTAERIGLDDGVVKKVSCGCFRQTFATQSDEAGASEQDTAMLLGHADTKMLRTVYSGASRKVRHVRRAAENAERLRREARRAKRTQGEA